MENLVFTQLSIPEIRNIFRQELENYFVNQKIFSSDSQDSDKWFSIDELSEYLPGNPAKPTIYAWVSRKEIPHKKYGRRLAFRKSQIDAWLDKKGCKTMSDIEAEAEEMIVK